MKVCLPIPPARPAHPARPSSAHPSSTCSSHPPVLLACSARPCAHAARPSRQLLCSILVYFPHHTIHIGTATQFIWTLVLLGTVTRSIVDRAVHVGAAMESILDRTVHMGTVNESTMDRAVHTMNFHLCFIHGSYGPHDISKKKPMKMRTSPYYNALNIVRNLPKLTKFGKIVVSWCGVYFCMQASRRHENHSPCSPMPVSSIWMIWQPSSWRPNDANPQLS